MTTPRRATPGPGEPLLAGGKKKPKTAGMRWVLAALPPADRRALIEDTLAPWVAWLVHTYRLRTTIPACWYRHPDAVERLKNLMVAWIRTFAETTTDRPAALVEFDDALERELRRLHIPDRCLDGEHDEPPTGWTTDTDLTAWLETSAWATAARAHPTPLFAPKERRSRDPGTSDRQTTIDEHIAGDTGTDPADDAPRRTGGHHDDGTVTGGPDGEIPDGAAEGIGDTGADDDGDETGDDNQMIMSRAQADRLVAQGRARPLRDFAIRYDDSWWMGDEHLFARVTDQQLATTLDKQARKLAAADRAVARASAQQHSEDTPTPDPGDDEIPPPGKPCGDGP